MTSKPGAIGNNMAAALQGNIPGTISKNYKGKPKNADTTHPHSAADAQPVAKWTQNHMQSQKKAAAKK